MKKVSTKKDSDRIAQLKAWKESSTRTKIDWLDHAYKFGKLKRF